MRLSALNIWKTWRDRHAQQEREVAENSAHPPMVWNMWEHNVWGDKIGWLNWDTRRLVGWTTPLPTKGDEIRAKLQSGRTGRFKVIKVEPQVDPSDMWFAYVEDVGYLEDKDG